MRLVVALSFYFACVRHIFRFGCVGKAVSMKKGVELEREEEEKCVSLGERYRKSEILWQKEKNVCVARRERKRNVAVRGRE